MADTGRIQCVVCGVDKYKREFYVSMSPVWGKLDGKLHVCKDCIQSMYDYYQREKLLGMRATIIALCRKYDIFFDEDIYTSCIEDAKKKSGIPIIFLYINKVNLILTNKKEIKSFDDSLLDEVSKMTIQSEIESGYDLNLDQKRKLIKFWGDKNVWETEEELIRLQETYEAFLKNYSNDMVKRKYFQLLSVEYLRLEKTKNPKDRKDIAGIIANLTDKANLSPKDTEQNNKDSEIKTLGMVIKDIETKEPVDYDVKEKAVYKDYRGFKKYIDEYLYKPIKKAFGVE